MKFETPQTVEQAVALLAADSGARVLAGGTDLLVRLRAGHIAPSAIVDIKHIDGMGEITQEADGGWRIGAGVPCAAMGEHAGLVADYPGVVEGAELIGSTQVQGRCTMVGNLCNAGPAGDSVPALVAAGAMVRVAGPNGTRDVPVIEIPTAPGKPPSPQASLSPRSICRPVARAAAMPTCALFRAPRWTSPWSAARST